MNNSNNSLLSWRSIQSAVGLCALFLTIPVQAAPYNIDFTGIITNSRDSGGVIFGGASFGGQNGLTISGQIIFDDAAYTDLSPGIYNGTYGPNNGLFPQPSNYFLSSYTINGQTFMPSQWMGVPTGHSNEFASIQDIPPVNYVQQDILHYFDGSQELHCDNPTMPTRCNGALSTDELQLKLFGIYDFVSTDSITQLLNLSTADITNIISAPGGGQSNFYTGYRTTFSPSTGFTLVHNYGGEFNLTSLKIYARPAASVPEPASIALLGLGLLGLGLARRRKA